MSTRAIPPLVAVTSKMSTNEISGSELAQVAGALQKQVTRDIAPAWHTPASVTAYPDPNKVPHGYWPLTIEGDIGDPNALGYHSDARNVPYSVIQFDPTDWPSVASHELAEMLGDPWGSRFVVGRSLVAEQGRVEYLLELADPCETFAYEVDGVVLSDFILPHYHHPFSRVQTPYSFTGKLTRAREVAPGGYLSWYVRETDEWWQRTFFNGDAPRDQSLGRHAEIRQPDETPRAMIDRLTPRTTATILVDQDAD